MRTHSPDISYKILEFWKRSWYLGIVVLKKLVLSFDKIKMSELEICMDGMELTFNTSTSPYLDVINSCKQFLILRTVKNPSHESG